MDKIAPAGSRPRDDAPGSAPATTPGEESRASRADRSAHRTYPVVASPDDRRFVRTFLVAFIGLVGTLAALNVVVDPLGYFGVGLLPRVTWDDRDEKAAMFVAQRLRPQLLVVGSSRTMKLDPACATRLTGLSAFNFGVSGGRPEDFAAIVQFVEDRAGPSLRRIVIGVEPDIMLDDVSIGAFARQSRFLGPYVRAGGVPASEMAAAAFGQGATMLSLASLWHAMRGRRAALPPVQIRRDGMLFYRDELDAPSRAMAERDSKIAGQRPALRQAFADAHHLSPQRIALLRGLLTRARARGIQVDAFIPPTHPAMVAELRGTAFDARLRETEALLRSLAAEGLLVHHVTTPGERIGLDPNAYFDAYHLMQPNADRLLGIVLGAGGGCAL